MERMPRKSIAASSMIGNPGALILAQIKVLAEWFAP
jgi:hypothetical protein